jgi:hypothetical protein
MPMCESFATCRPCAGGTDASLHDKIDSDTLWEGIMIRTFTPEIAEQVCEILGLDSRDTITLVVTSRGVFVTTHRRNAGGEKFFDPFTDEIAKDYAYIPAGYEEV